MPWDVAPRAVVGVVIVTVAAAIIIVRGKTSIGKFIRADESLPAVREF